MRRFGKLSAGLFAAMFLVNGASAWAGELADTVYHNNDGKAKIYTMQEAKVDESNRLIPVDKDTPPIMVDVVAVKDGKIVFAGNKDEAEKYFDTKKVDRIVALDEGSAMYPGFIDGHSHFPLQGEDDLTKVNLRSPLFDGTVHTIKDLKDAIKAQAEIYNDPEIPIIGYCYDDTLLFDEDGKTVYGHPTAADLDVVPNPVYIKHISNHVAVVNTPVLEKFKVKQYVGQDKYAGVVADEDGNPTGLLLETDAMSTVAVNATNYPKMPSPGTNAILARATAVYAAAGVTTADNGGSAYIMDIPSWQNGLVSGALGVRVVSHPFGYFNAGPNFELGTFNRMALGWMDVKKAPGENVPKTGDDITMINIGHLESLMGAPEGSMSTPAGLDAKDRIFLGAWKFIFDGSPQAYTAWMKNPGFYDWGGYDVKDNDKNFGSKNSVYSFEAKNFSGLAGTMNINVDDMANYIDMYHQYGYSTETHTNGSAAAEAWVSIIEETVKKHADKGIKDTRHTSIHGQTLERQHIERMAGKYDGIAATADMYTDLMGAAAEAAAGKTLGNLPQLMKDQNLFTSFFNNHVYFYGDRHHDIFFGPGRAMNISPSGWAHAYGMPYSFHNDTDVTPISPLRSIQTAVTRLTAGDILLSKENEDNDPTKKFRAYQHKDNPETEREFWAYDHRITALQALHAVTTGPAWQNKLEDKIGKIAPDMLADFTIMEKDILEVAETAPETIANMKVAATIVGDKLIYGILPGSGTIAADGVVAAYEQPAGKKPVVTSVEDLSEEAITSGEYAPLLEGDTFLAAKEFEATVDNTGNKQNAVFSFMIQGDGETKLSALKLHKLYSNERLVYEYGKPEDIAARESCGKWWLVDFATNTVAEDDVLKADKTYLVNFIICDNSKFDADKERGKIKDLVVLSSGEAEEASNPFSSGSSGGCTVGTNSAYELLALLLASLGVMAGRIFRRRNA